jgi:hypothetical protein
MDRFMNAAKSLISEIKPAHIKYFPDGKNSKTLDFVIYHHHRCCRRTENYLTISQSEKRK